MDAESAITLVTTKLTAPTPPAPFVTRPRLESALERAVSDRAIRVVLVSAPAGSGKSTLVAAWQQQRTDCAWLQVDPADRDAARFWAHVVAALATVAPGINDTLQSSITRSSFDPEPLIDRLANELASSPAITLVIDDYHLVTGPAIDAAIERLIELAPSTLTLVLLTRIDPAIRLSRLRMAGHLAEVRADDLRFIEDEAAGLLDDDRLETSETSSEHVRLLCDRTEGWAAGLVLARLSLLASSDRSAFVETFRGDDRLVVDYLTDELLAQISAEEQQRLLTTSVLEEMSGPLINAVCDCTDGVEWLDDLASRNQLVIGLGRSSGWYRYHHLLRDVLRMKASASLPVDDLHRRAGAWHRTHGDLDRAAEHLLQAGDLDTAADVIADHSMHLLNLGQLDTVSGYLSRLGATVDTHLLCGCIAGWIHVVSGRVDSAERSLKRLRTLEAECPTDAMTAGLIAGLAVMIHLGRGNVAGAIADGLEAPEIAEATQTLVIGQSLVWGGRFDDAKSRLERAGSLANENDDRFALAGVPSISAVAALESGEVELARRLADQTIDAIAHRGAPSGGHAALAHSVIARTTDDPDTAASAARQAVAFARQATGLLAPGYALASAADVLSAHDEPEGPTLIAEARAIVNQCTDPGIVGRYLARVEARHQLATPPPSNETMVEELTDRELAVLRYLPAPMSQREIAAELYVSLNTVKTHCKAIYRKLGVGDRKAAVQAARDFDLL